MRRTFTIEVTIDSRPDVPDVDVFSDLTRILTNVQEPAPHRSPDGADWWTRSNAVVCGGIRTVSADPDARNTPDGLCWSWGPRIGDDTRPVCKQPFGHDGPHRGFDGSGFESETWGAPRMPVPEHLR